jgi:hypothetical protein
MDVWPTTVTLMIRDWPRAGSHTVKLYVYACEEKAPLLPNVIVLTEDDVLVLTSVCVADRVLFPDSASWTFITTLFPTVQPDGSPAGQT